MSKRLRRSQYRAAVFLAAVYSLLSTGCRAGTRADLEAPGPPDAKRLLVLVSNEGSNDLSLIDSASETVVQTVPVGKRPRGMKVSRDGQRVYVALSGSPRGVPTWTRARCLRQTAAKTASACSSSAPAACSRS